MLMRSETHKRGLREIAGALSGILVLLAAVLLATSLCTAASDPTVSSLRSPFSAGRLDQSKCGFRPRDLRQRHGITLFVLGFGTWFDIFPL